MKERINEPYFQTVKNLETGLEDGYSSVRGVGSDAVVPGIYIGEGHPIETLLLKDNYMGNPKQGCGPGHAYKLRNRSRASLNYVRHLRVGG